MTLKEAMQIVNDMVGDCPKEDEALEIALACMEMARRVADET